MIYLNKIKFVWLQQSIFEPNENLFKPNQFLPSNKLCLWPYTNAIIYLIQTNIYLSQRYFVWIKQMLFDSNKCLFITKIFCLNWTNVIWFK